MIISGAFIFADSSEESRWRSAFDPAVILRWPCAPSISKHPPHSTSAEPFKFFTRTSSPARSKIFLNLFLRIRLDTVAIKKALFRLREKLDGLALKTLPYI